MAIENNAPVNGFEFKDCFNSSLFKTNYYKLDAGNGEKFSLLAVFPDNWKPSDRRGAFVWIHGGAWVAGNAEMALPMLRYFAHRGMVAFSVDYRLLKADKEQKILPPLELKDQVEDCRKAIDFIRSNAAKLGINPDKIAVSGDSAGAHLTLCLAALEDKDQRYPNLAAACNPITEMTGQWEKFATGSSAGHAFSPLRRIRDKAAVPVLLLHGKADGTVEPEHSEKFYQAWQKAGNPTEITLYDHALHAFAVTDYTATDAEIVRAWRDIDKFLFKYGYLSGNPDLNTGIRHPGEVKNPTIPGEMNFSGKVQTFALAPENETFQKISFDFYPEKRSGVLCVRSNSLHGGEILFYGGKFGVKNRRYQAFFPADKVKLKAWNSVSLTLSPEKSELTLNGETVNIENPAQAGFKGDKISFGKNFSGKIRNVKISNL